MRKHDVEGAQVGDRQALEAIFRDTRKLRAEIIRRVAGETMIEKFGWDELDAVASVGVMEAIKRYDSEHPSGRSFEQVLSYRIRQEVMIYVADNSGSLRIPVPAYQLAHRSIDPLTGEEDAWNMTDAELEELTGISGAGAIVRARLQPTDIMRPSTDEDGETTMEPIEELAEDYDEDEETDISALRMFGLLIKVDDEHERARIARRWAYEMGYPQDVADRMLEEVRHARRN